VYLSEIGPASTAYVPYLGRVWRMRHDRSVWGRPLTVKGETFARGLGLAPRTTLVYATDGRFERFEARVGIDDETRGKGKAALTITTDGRQAFNRTLAGGGKAVPVNIPLAGVKQVTILVDFGPDDDIGDHVDLGDARLIKVRRQRH